MNCYKCKIYIDEKVNKKTWQRWIEPLDDKHTLCDSCNKKLETLLNLATNCVLDTFFQTDHGEK